MKICLINNLYKPFIRGGAEKVTATIAQGLIKAGHEIFIITTKPYNKKFSIFNFQFSIYHLNSFYYDLNKLPKFLRLFWHIWDMFDVVNYFKVKKILKKEKCDAVITNNLMGLGYLTALAIKKLKIKHLHIVHDIQLIHPSGLLFWGQENKLNGVWAKNYAGLCSRLFDSPAVVIFPSRWLRDKHLDNIFFIKSKRIIMPNPVELNMAARPEKNNDIFKFVFLGQIEKHKGVFLLIRAFREINKKYPACELLIAGQGSQLEQAKQAAAQAERIKFLGWLGDEQIDKLFNDVGCLVYPSLVYENCPQAIQRALAAGLPVLASDLGGVSELLNKNAGLLFKPADVKDLTDKMEWLIVNKNNLKNIILAGQEKVALCHVDNYVKELEKLLAPFNKGACPDQSVGG